MKFSLCITQSCNLSCNYCCIEKKENRMPLLTAQKVIDLIFRHTPPQDRIVIRFFGGEPLLEFGLIKDITGMIEEHPFFDYQRTELQVITNGTIFSDEIGLFLKEHDIRFHLSCDGPPFINDNFRCFPDGKGSSRLIENTIRRASKVFPVIPVNAVYHPETFRYLPQAIDYFSSLGLKHISLSPDLTARWSKKESGILPEIYGEIAHKYIKYHLVGTPHFISLVDSKISALLRGGYRPEDRCCMGKHELAFAPSGNIYPCEQLIGSDNGIDHCIGNIDTGVDPERLSCMISPEKSINDECVQCGIRDYCMNWCGFSNYFSSGSYDRASPFLCASERAAIEAALGAYQIVEAKLGPDFFENIEGVAGVNISAKW